MSSPPKNEHPLYEKSKGPIPTKFVARPKGRPSRPAADRPVLSIILIAVNGLIFLAMMVSVEINELFFVHGALYAPLVVAEGQVYRMLTAMFLHGSLPHVLFNMYALYIVGGTVEPIFGRRRFLLVYVLGGLTGSALSLALGDFRIPSVGASGAVFAIFAAEAVHLYQHRGVYANVRGRLRHMLILIGMNLVIGFLPGSRIDNWGHIGGLAGGLVLAWRIAPRMGRPTSPPRSMREFAGLDSNPLRLHLPILALYCFALIGFVVLTVNLLAAAHVF